MQDFNARVLVEGCIKGDKSVWDKFVERFSGLIYWVIKERLGRTNYHYNQQDIEDIFQDVFVLLWEKGKLRQIRHRENISGWLIMVSANCAINYFRNKRVVSMEKELLSEKVTSSNCSAREIIDKEKSYNIFERMLNSLSPREIAILKLNYLYDKTHQQIAELLKMPQNTVSSIIKRSKEKLKERLKEQGWDDF